MAAHATSRAFAFPSTASIAAPPSSRRTVEAKKARDDDLMTLLADVVESDRSSFRAEEKPTKHERPASSSSSNGSSQLEAGSSWRSSFGAPKKVVSARELLMNLMPRRPSTAEAKQTRPAPVYERSAAQISRPAEQKQSDETVLSPSELIARKYGFKPSGAFSKPAATTEKEQQHERLVGVVPQSKPSAELELQTRKKSFWEEQLSRSSNVAAPNSKYLSPFRSAESFEDMQQKRRKSMETRNVSAKANDQRRSVDAATAGSSISAAATAAVDSDRRPSRFNTSDADDNLWFSDGSGGEPDKADEKSTPASDTSAVKVSPGAGHSIPASAPRLQARMPRKRKRRSTDLQLDSANSFDEHWPKLPPPAVRGHNICRYPWT